MGAGDRPFSHPYVGSEVRVEQHGREVRLIFVCGTPELAEDVCDGLVSQLKDGVLHLSLMGKVSSVEES